jgi:hypothetical protein
MDQFSVGETIPSKRRAARGQLRVVASRTISTPFRRSGGHRRLRLKDTLPLLDEPDELNHLPLVLDPTISRWAPHRGRVRARTGRSRVSTSHDGEPGATFSATSSRP